MSACDGEYLYEGQKSVKNQLSEVQLWIMLRLSEFEVIFRLVGVHHPVPKHEAYT